MLMLTVTWLAMGDVSCGMASASMSSSTRCARCSALASAQTSFPLARQRIVEAAPRGHFGERIDRGDVGTSRSAGSAFMASHT